MKVLKKTLKEFRSDLQIIQSNNETNPKEQTNEVNDSKTIKKPKISIGKLKEMKEQKILNAFEEDSKKFLEIRVNCGLDVESQKCKKWDFVSHSEGLLRKHRVEDHKLKDSFQNLVLGYEIDLKKHIEVLQAMGEETHTSKCDKCEFKASGEGKLEMHKNNNH